MPVATTVLSVTILVGCLPAGSERNTNEAPVESDKNVVAEHETDVNLLTEEDTPDYLVYPPLDENDAVAFLSEYGQATPGSKVLLSTNFGDIAVRLYDDTPLHRANFLYLIERDYYNPTTIVRVVPNFVIQGGNSDEREDRRKRSIIGSYTLPAEFKDHYIHKRGALAMSRSYIENPQKRSSAYDFYIVLGEPLSQASLHTTSLENKREYTQSQKKQYMTEGGAPHLDNEHTVFGEVIQGMEVVEKISRIDRDASDWPRTHVEVRMKVMNN